MGRLLIVAVLAASASYLAAEDALPDDKDLRRRVGALLEEFPLTADRPLIVTVSGRRARLDGKLPTLWAVWEAERVAGQVYGLLAVDNHARVGSSFSDETIRSDLGSLLSSSSKWRDVSFEVDQATVTLTGYVADALARFAARKGAAESRGVHEVVELIAVPPLDDATIHKILERRLRKRMRATSAKVEPMVRAGIVVLEGSVPRPSEAIEYARVAWDIAGVREVVDRLTVVPELPPDPP